MINTPGVLNIVEFEIVGKSGVINNLIYSDVSYDSKRYMDRGFLFPPRGGIFELKYENDDIVGRVT
jgi:hypothetical protein